MSSNPATFGSEFTQEIRFAVVILRRIIARNLYERCSPGICCTLVRATAPVKLPVRCTSTRSPALERSIANWAECSIEAKLPRRNWNRSDNIKTRFIIDILSGTSAGGINSVFLAKALANDLELTSLAKYAGWIQQTSMCCSMTTEAKARHRSRPSPSSTARTFTNRILKRRLKDMDLTRPG
jgi:hypothetical protein